MNFNAAELIQKKRRGLAHSNEEIDFLIREYTAERLPDYQMSAWAMAVCFQGMTSAEVAHFTRAMRDSGQKLNLSKIKKFKVDKHSTGGVGDKTSLLIGPIVACAGAAVPMIAGRGLGHTGGTLDKLESLKGFSVNLTLEEFEKTVASLGFSLIGQTKEICPADKKLYALRDVTGTVDCLPLICGSIMSKKLCEDLNGLVLDVKFGSGAFMKSFEDAKSLAQLLKDTGEKNGVKVSAYLTSMEQPLGRFAGNALEVKECLDILQGKTHVENGIDLYEDTRILSLSLAAEMICQAQLKPDYDSAYVFAEEILSSGQAFDKFKDVCLAQGVTSLDSFQISPNTLVVKAPLSGYLSQLDTEKIGLATLELGAGRRTKDDSIDPTTGIEYHTRLGQPVKADQTLMTIYYSSKSSAEKAHQMILEATQISSHPIQPPSLIREILR